MNSNSPGSGLEPKPFAHIGVPTIVPERLTERVLVHRISVLTRPEYYFHLNEFQSALPLIHLRYGTNTCSYCIKVWHKPIRYMTLHLGDRRGAASLVYRNSAKINLFSVWTEELSDIVLVPAQELSVILCKQPKSYLLLGRMVAGLMYI